MRVLALDHGQARIGSATCDPSGTVVRPLRLVEPTVEAVKALVEEVSPERVVVGVPVTLSGGESGQAEAVREFCAELAGEIEVPVDTYDERLTTRMAGRSRRHGARADEDCLAAAHLLESYLATGRTGEAESRE